MLYIWSEKRCTFGSQREHPGSTALAELEELHLCDSRFSIRLSSAGIFVFILPGDETNAVVWCDSLFIFTVNVEGAIWLSLAMRVKIGSGACFVQLQPDICLCRRQECAELSGIVIC